MNFNAIDTSAAMPLIPSRRVRPGFRAFQLVMLGLFLGSRITASPAAEQPPATAVEEVKNIKRRLTEADELTRTAPSLEAALVSFSRIGASLDLFEMRY